MTFIRKFDKEKNFATSCCKISFSNNYCYKLPGIINYIKVQKLPSKLIKMSK